jgi:hypothetical protein
MPGQAALPVHSGIPSTLGLRQQAFRSLGTEFVFVHLDRDRGPAATGDAAASDQFQGALAVQLEGPTDGNLETLSRGQRRLSVEEYPLAADIQGLTGTPAGVATATQNPVAQISDDGEPIVSPAVGCLFQGREARF